MAQIMDGLKIVCYFKFLPIPSPLYSKVRVGRKGKQQESPEAIRRVGGCWGAPAPPPPPPPPGDPKNSARPY